MQQRIKVRRPSRTTAALFTMAIAFLGFIAGYAIGVIVHFL